MTAPLAHAVDSQLSRSVPPERRAELWAAPRLDRGLWREFAASGWFSALLPEKLDGLGLPPGEVAGLFECAGRHLVPGPFVEHVLLVPLLAGYLGDFAGLAELADGSRLLSWWDPEAVGAPADSLRVDAAGAVSGSAGGVRFAADADFFLVAAASARAADCAGRSLAAGADSADSSLAAGADSPRASGADGSLAIVLLPRFGPAGGGAGLTKPGRLDLRGAPGQVLLDGAQAAEFLERARAWSRLATVLELSGTSAWLVAQSTEFAKVRHQFGRPIGQFQALAHLVADLAVHDIALRNLCAALVEDAGRAPAPAAAMGAKAYAARVALRIAEGALQAHGGIGFTQEHPLHMYFKHTLHLWAWYGDPRRLAARIGQAALSG
jgi:alkylation response protein AidB-like acyl-CoA dehydrogenase